MIFSHLLLAAGVLAAHEHGTAKLDVVVDGTKVRIALDGPAVNAFGFEHVPKSDADKKIVTDVLKQLRDPLKLFGLPAAANCVVTESQVASSQEDAMLGNAQQKAHAHEGGDHAEVEAQWDFTCKATPAGGTLALDAFFAAFPKMQQLKLQLIVGDKQSGRTLTPADKSITL